MLSAAAAKAAPLMRGDRALAIGLGGLGAYQGTKYAMEKTSSMMGAPASGFLDVASQTIEQGGIAVSSRYSLGDTGIGGVTTTSAVAAAVGTGASYYAGQRMFKGFKPEGGAHQMYPDKSRFSFKGAGSRFLTNVQNAGGRVVGGMLGVAGAATLLNRSVDRLAQKVVTSGTPYSRAASSSMMPGGRTRRSGSSTTSRVSRYAGQSAGQMSGDTVLQLHKTGGRGAVMT